MMKLYGIKFHELTKMGKFGGKTFKNLVSYLNFIMSQKLLHSSTTLLNHPQIPLKQHTSNKVSISDYINIFFNIKGNSVAINFDIFYQSL